MEYLIYLVIAGIIINGISVLVAPIAGYLKAISLTVHCALIPLALTFPIYAVTLVLLHWLIMITQLTIGIYHASRLINHLKSKL